MNECGSYHLSLIVYTKNNVNKQVNARVNQIQPQMYSIISLMSQNVHYNYYLMLYEPRIQYTIAQYE